ncbi:hypothetical protein AAFF_G00001840 [Aldrovandia affinis]|uniref:Uncharacterized protein n=1 Tax=Aldrovandia affinis TaxID=143900 RepID=A0AAD7TCY8_9TELE|nr:hypothetical protein AAFF_G00001840 [Aldrovandia affinis]
MYPGHRDRPFRTVCAAPLGLLARRPWFHECHSDSADNANRCSAERRFRLSGTVAHRSGRQRECDPGRMLRTPGAGRKSTLGEQVAHVSPNCIVAMATEALAGWC